MFPFPVTLPGCWRSKPSARRIRILAMPAPVGSTKKMGFLALEETDLWGEDTPCLIMVKPLGG